MIRVRVELLSARTGEVTELARMHLCNTSGGGTLRDYEAHVLRGRSRDALEVGSVQRSGRVLRWPSDRLHVWNLVQEALTRLGYGRHGRIGAEERADAHG